jgi:hypothetical protein
MRSCHFRDGYPLGYNTKAAGTFTLSCDASGGQKVTVKRITPNEGGEGSALLGDFKRTHEVECRMLPRLHAQSADQANHC